MKLTLSPYPYSDQIPHGTLQTFEIEMKPYPDARRRTIRVWLPEQYDGQRRYPVLYLHDGQNVFRGPDDRAKWECDRALTALAGEGISCIVVAIDTAETRGSELTPAHPRAATGITVNGIAVPVIREPSTSDLYADFVVHCLKPLIDENFMTLTDAGSTCIGGASAGGTMSYYMMLRNPEVFGRALCYSPGFPIFSLDGLLQILDEYDFSRLKDHRISFYNGDVGLESTSMSYVVAVYRKLREKGLDSTQVMAMIDTRQPHYESAWSKYLPESLRFLFAKDNSVTMPPV
jgi:predicted alpha/beta superfamily hydrolase